MQDKPTPEQIAKAALASLSKSASVGGRSNLSEADKRDMDLRQMENYRQPGWTKEESIGTESSPASTTLMVRLWELMTELYGHKWTSVHGLGDESGTWAKMMSGISPAQMAAGARAWVNQGGEAAKWPPGAVDLRDMCRSVSGEQSGIPDVAAAWREAVEASSDVINWKFSHPIVQEAARLTDWYSIRTGTPKAETVQNRFNKRYADLVAKLQRGEPLVDGQLQIGHDEAQSLLEKSDQANDFLVKQRIKDQGLHTKTAAELRAELLAKMGIKR